MGSATWGFPVSVTDSRISCHAGQWYHCLSWRLWKYLGPALGFGWKKQDQQLPEVVNSNALHFASATPDFHLFWHLWNSQETY